MRPLAAIVALCLIAPVATAARALAGPALAAQSPEAERARQIAEEARQRAEEARQRVEIARQDAEARRVSVNMSGPMKVGGSGDGTYSSGHSALQQRQYERAISQFDQAIARLTTKADGALYWRAFAQYCLGQNDLALASLTQLRRDFGQSRYLADAKVLETEVRKPSARASGAAAASDEEIKLLAIQGVQRSAQAVPILEGVLTGVNSLAIKKRALSALASTEDVRARTVVVNYAKGSGNPDLQLEAIRVIGSRRDTPFPDADLRALYTGNRDTSVRLAVVSALASQENADALVAFARTETDLDLKRELVRRISDLAPRSKVAADFLTGVLQ